MNIELLKQSSNLLDEAENLVIAALENLNEFLDEAVTDLSPDGISQEDAEYIDDCRGELEHIHNELFCLYRNLNQIYQVESKGKK